MNNLKQRYYNSAPKSEIHQYKSNKTQDLYAEDYKELNAWRDILCS